MSLLDVDNTQNIISFCTGYGGLELGLELAGFDFRTVCYVEIEAYAIANLVAKIEESKMASAPIWSDLKTFPAQKFSGRVHGIIGGYPCQPFSTAGKKLGDKDPRHLWPYIREHVRTIRPLWCFFENVRGHINNGLRQVKSDLEELGYSVDAGIFSAAEVGAPHRRERIFILANAESFGALRESRGSSKKAEGSRGTLSWEPKRSNKSTELANPELSGSSRLKQDLCKPEFFAKTEINKACISGNWPSRPNEKQFDWEEPRTIKSGLGLTVDGFTSQVDQLRLLGNGVVPKTAAKAWIELNNQLNDKS